MELNTKSLPAIWIATALTTAVLTAVAIRQPPSPPTLRPTSDQPPAPRHHEQRVGARLWQDPYEAGNRAMQAQETPTVTHASEPEEPSRLDRLWQDAIKQSEREKMLQDLARRGLADLLEQEDASLAKPKQDEAYTKLKEWLHLAISDSWSQKPDSDPSATSASSKPSRLNAHRNRILRMLALGDCPFTTTQGERQYDDLDHHSVIRLFAWGDLPGHHSHDSSLRTELQDLSKALSDTLERSQVKEAIATYLTLEQITLEKLHSLSTRDSTNSNAQDGDPSPNDSRNPEDQVPQNSNTPNEDDEKKIQSPVENILSAVENRKNSLRRSLTDLISETVINPNNPHEGDWENALNNQKNPLDPQEILPARYTQHLQDYPTLNLRSSMIQQGEADQNEHLKAIMSASETGHANFLVLHAIEQAMPPSGRTIISRHLEQDDSNSLPCSSATNPNEQLESLLPNSPTLIFILPSQESAETRERRLRIRYAVQMALRDQGYTPELTDELRWIPIPLQAGSDHLNPSLSSRTFARREPGASDAAQSESGNQPFPQPYFEAVTLERFTPNGTSPEQAPLNVIWAHDRLARNGDFSLIQEIHQRLHPSSDYHIISTLGSGEFQSYLNSLQRSDDFQREYDLVRRVWFPYSTADIGLISGNPYARWISFIVTNFNQQFRALVYNLDPHNLRAGLTVYRSLYTRVVSCHLTLIADSQRVVADDRQILDRIVSELMWRNPETFPPRQQPCEQSPEQQPRVLLIVEQDTLYSRNMSRSFQDSLSATTNLDGQAVTHLHYLRGIDGDLPSLEFRNEAVDVHKVLPQLAAAAFTRRREDSQRLFDRRQIDYLQRAAINLRRQQLSLPVDQRIKAIGVLGSDIYDKLMILELFRSEFPDVQFFTTDLDAVLLEAPDRVSTRNLIVGSAFPLDVQKLGTSPMVRSLEQFSPSHTTRLASSNIVFRESYQTSLYFTTRAAIGRLLNSELTGPSTAPAPVVYDTGRTRFHELQPLSEISLPRILNTPFSFFLVVGGFAGAFVLCIWHIGRAFGGCGTATATKPWLAGLVAGSHAAPYLVALSFFGLIVFGADSILMKPAFTAVVVTCILAAWALGMGWLGGARLKGFRLVSNSSISEWRGEWKSILYFWLCFCICLVIVQFIFILWFRRSFMAAIVLCSFVLLACLSIWAGRISGKQGADGETKDRGAEFPFWLGRPAERHEKWAMIAAALIVGASAVFVYAEVPVFEGVSNGPSFFIRFLALVGGVYYLRAAMVDWAKIRRDCKKSPDKVNIEGIAKRWLFHSTWVTGVLILSGEVFSGISSGYHSSTRGALEQTVHRGLFYSTMGAMAALIGMGIGCHRYGICLFAKVNKMLEGQLKQPSQEGQKGGREAVPKPEIDDLSVKVVNEVTSRVSGFFGSQDNLRKGRRNKVDEVACAFRAAELVSKSLIPPFVMFLILLIARHSLFGPWNYPTSLWIGTGIVYGILLALGVVFASELLRFRRNLEQLGMRKLAAEGKVESKEALDQFIGEWRGGRGGRVGGCLSQPVAQGLLLLSAGFAIGLIEPLVARLL